MPASQSCDGADNKMFFNKMSCNNPEDKFVLSFCSSQVESNLCIDVADIRWAIRGNLDPQILESSSLDRWCCWEINNFLCSKKWLPNIHSSSTWGLNLHPADEVSVCTIQRAATRRVLSIRSSFSWQKNLTLVVYKLCLQIMLQKIMVVEGAIETSNPAKRTKFRWIQL